MIVTGEIRHFNTDFECVGSYEMVQGELGCGVMSKMIGCL